MPRRITHLCVEVGRRAGPIDDDDDTPKSGGGALRSGSTRRSRRHSPYPASAALPQVSAGLSAPMAGMGLASDKAFESATRRGFQNVGTRASARGLPPLTSRPLVAAAAAAGEAATSAVSAPLGRRTRLAPIVDAAREPSSSSSPALPLPPPLLDPSALSGVGPAKARQPSPAKARQPSQAKARQAVGKIEALTRWPPPPPGAAGASQSHGSTRAGSSGAGSGLLSQESRDERRRRKAEAAKAAIARRTAAEAADERKEREAIVASLMAYDEEASAPPSPASELYAQAQAAADTHASRETRGRLRAALSAQLGVAQSLSRADFAPFLARLAVAHEPRGDDDWLAGRLFAGIDSGRADEVTAECVVKALFPAYSRDRTCRVRWLWGMLYDTQHKGFLSATDIFRLLHSLPEHSRIAEDVLSIVKAAARKCDAGEPVRVYEAEYVAGLHGGERAEELDVLGLRRRSRRGSDVTRLVRARAHGLLLAKHWGALHAAPAAPPL